MQPTISIVVLFVLLIVVIIHNSFHVEETVSAALLVSLGLGWAVGMLTLLRFGRSGVRIVKEELTIFFVLVFFIVLLVLLVVIVTLCLTIATILSPILQSASTRESNIHLLPPLQAC